MFDFLRRHRLKLVVSVLLSLGVIYTAEHNGIEIIPAARSFSTVRWGMVAFYLPVLLAMMWFRSVRWRFLLRPIIEVPRQQLVAVSFVGFMAIVLLPFRLGELVRPYLMHMRSNDPRTGRRALTMTAATSSVVAERIIDGVFLSVLLAIVLVFVPTVHPLPERVVGLPVSVAQVRAAGFVMLGVFVSALATIAAFYFMRSFMQRAIRAIVGKVSTKLADKIADFAGHAADGLHVFRRGRDALGYLAETTLYWALTTGGLWLVGVACGVVHADGSSLTFPEACGLIGLLGVTMLIPAPPGQIGVFQLGLYAGMTMYVPSVIVTGPGAAYVFLIYVSQLVVQILLGVWGVFAIGGTHDLREALERDQSAQTRST
ncbi:MAG TPA: lysylphosphatidylglycerol synthase transmembrane domain-containing protein [Kofleriaceae bacterium]|nr:lysylphosphatidylglycerol synthase transmembrane domain-containing protein [Kofleriaceae bacterium]